MQSENVKQESEMMKPLAASDVKKGHFVMLEGHPCKVARMLTAKTGKHGHMKVRITGYCLLTNEKFETIRPGHGILYVPDVNKAEFLVTDINENDDNSFSLIDAKDHHIVVDLPNNKMKEEVIENRKKDVEGTKDFFVTLLEAPITVSGKLETKRTIFSWKEVKVDTE